MKPSSFPLSRRTVLGLGLAPLAPAVLSQTAADNEIRIGQSCQLSGPLAGLTSDVRLGASLYFDSVNASGGVRGRKIRVIALDDAYDAGRAAGNTRKLIEEEKVLALFQYAGTPPALAALPIAEEHGVPFVSPFTGSDTLRQKSNRYVFNIRAGYGAELDAMAKHMATVGLTRIAAVYLNNSFGTSGLAALEKSLEQYKLTLLAKAPLEMDGGKLAQAVAATAAKEPQAVVVISAGQPSLDFLRAYADAGHYTTFYMLSVTSNVHLAKALGERARGVVVSQVVPAPWNGSVAVSREFQKLAAAKGLGEHSFSQMEGFLAAKLLVEALQRAGTKLTREGLVDALESLRNFDLGGFPVALSPAQHSSARYVDLLIVGRGGKFAR